tara:strand:- start:8795 stop:9238 length:444 start_codon:yes stop_codon:yes gene_type:complete
MMLTDDKTGFGIGLGYMLGQLKFNTYVSKDSEAKVGFRVRRSVTWRTEPALHVIPYIKQVLDIGGLTYFVAHEQGFTSNKAQLELRLLLQTINKEYPILNAFADSVGYHMWTFVHDNPPPNDYEEFLSWAEAYDAEHEQVSYEEGSN